MKSYTLNITIAVIVVACLTHIVTALPFEAGIKETPVTLLDIEDANQSSIDPEAEKQRAARGLGLELLGGKFGGGGGFGHGFKGFGGFGGLGLGSFKGLGGGFGFKPLFGKHFG